MNRQYILGVIVMLMLSVVACTERIELNLNAGDPVLVVYGCVTDTLAYQKVTLSSSVPYFDEQHNPAISGAVVSITSDSEVWILIENPIEKGVYETTGLKAGKIGETYHLKVEYDFDEDGVMELYEASTEMLPAFKIDSVQVKPFRAMGYYMYSVNLYADEPAGEDYYLHKFFVNDSLVTPLSRYSLMGDNELIDGQYINGMPIYFMGDILYWDDFTKNEQEEEAFVGEGDEVLIEVNRVDKKYFNFVRQCQNEKYGSNPLFGGPPSNIQGNISNGAVGFFAAFTTSRYLAITPGSEDYIP